MRLPFNPVSTRLAVAFLLCGGFTWLVLASHQDAFRKNVAVEFYFHHDHIIGTSLDIWITTTDEASAESAERAMLDEIERLRRIFSTYDPDSEICRLNGTREPMVASTEMIEVLKHYEIFQARSHGAFSGQLGDLVRI